MKKTIILLTVIITIMCLNKEDKIIIPKESIRFRVIANSDSEKDQKLKKKVLKNISNSIMKLEYNPKNLNVSRKEVKNTIPELTKVVEETLTQEHYEKYYNINYGMNYFPEKEYKGVVYKEGEYESLVITLGKGEGKNFWCVLFPPLCLLDEEEEKIDKVEYKSFVKEVLDKYF